MFSHFLAKSTKKSKNLLKNIPVDKIKSFEKNYIEKLNTSHRKVLDEIKAGKLTDEVINTLENLSLIHI